MEWPERLTPIALTRRELKRQKAASIADSQGQYILNEIKFQFQIAAGRSVMIKAWKLLAGGTDV
jgi:predicted transcriptional regulator